MEKRYKIRMLSNCYASTDPNHSEVCTVVDNTESEFASIQWDGKVQLERRFSDAHDLANQVNKMLNAQNESNKILLDKMSQLEERQLLIIQAQEKSNELFRKTILSLQKQINEQNRINND